MYRADRFVHWIITLVAYSVATIILLLVIIKEKEKRQNIEILSWSGRAQHTTTTTKTSKTIENPANGKDSQSHDRLYIAKSSHYLSYCVYFFALLVCIGGILRCIPLFCTRIHSLTIQLSSWGIQKVFIGIFQWNRYFLCFVNDQRYYKSSLSSKSMKLVTFICFMGLIIAIGLVIYNIQFIFLKDTVYFDVWCSFDNISSVNSYATGAGLILGDWSIVFLFAVSINKLSKLVQKKTNNTINSTGTSSNEISIKINKRLQSILTRILVCSIVD